jgi:transcriptional regulator with XRE-family HTH domain
MTNIRDVFADNLKKFRLARGWSQAFLAEKAATSTNYIGMLENTIKFPSSEMIHKLASALEIDTIDLFAKLNNPIITMKTNQKAALMAVSGLLENIITEKIQKLEEELEREND